MEKILTATQLLDLPIGSPIYKIENGNFHRFIVIGQHPYKADELINDKKTKVSIGLVVYSDLSVTDVRFISTSRIGNYYIGEYDKNVVGNIMIDQLYKEVDIIKEIYFNSNLEKNL